MRHLTMPLLVAYTLRMLPLTQKQSGLLNYIYKYRFNHGHTPELKEMVTELHISDNKSALRMIDALVEKGYLNKETKKTKTISLSDMGYQLVSSVPCKYESVTSELNKAELPSEYRQSGISVSLPISNALSHQQQKVDTSGTGGEIDINTIVETAVNLAIGKYFSGTQTTLFGSQTNKNFDVAPAMHKFINGIGLSANARWGLTLVTLTWAFNLVVESTLTAFCYAVLGSLLIKYLIKEQL